MSPKNAFIIVSIVSFAIMSFLFWVEFVNYLTPTVSEELFVDTSRSPNIQINIDIVMPRVSCDCKQGLLIYEQTFRNLIQF